MKKFIHLFNTAFITLAALGASMFGFNGVVAADSASCLFQYQSNGQFTTSATPVYNSICNVPNGVGNEPNFVRIRQSSNGNDMDNQNNPVYSDSLTSACTNNSKYDIWTYIHNNALSQDNNNGSGSAVAHNVTLTLNAPINTSNNTFNFSSTISASNAKSVTDSTSLNCSNNVKLTLVPSSVNIYSEPYNWHNLPDSTVNTTSKIGSPVMGSGDQWGCWTYRIVVVYEVQVTVIPSTPPPSPTNVCTGNTTNNNSGTAAQGGNCSTNTVTTSSPPPTPPTQLVNTGPGSLAAVFAGTTAIGSLGYRWLLGRRLARR